MVLGMAGLVLMLQALDAGDSEKDSRPFVSSQERQREKAMEAYLGQPLWDCEPWVRIDFWIASPVR